MEEAEIQRIIGAVPDRLRDRVVAIQRDLADGGSLKRRRREKYDVGVGLDAASSAMRRGEGVLHITRASDDWFAVVFMPSRGRK